jgi:hypothetical protein
MASLHRYVIVFDPKKGASATETQGKPGVRQEKNRDDDFTEKKLLFSVDLWASVSLWQMSSCLSATLWQILFPGCPGKTKGETLADFPFYHTSAV